MIKPLLALVTTGLLSMGVHNAVTSPPTVEATTERMRRTQAEIKDSALMTSAHAYQVSKTLDQPDRATALPGELQSFVRSAEHLARLREDLCKDLSRYDAAATEAINRFDEEAGQVGDERTMHSLAKLRVKTQDDVQTRLSNAQAALEQLDAGLAKGTDLQHAASAVLIADELHTDGTAIDEQLASAKKDAAQYAQTTNALLARINNALAD